MTDQSKESAERYEELEEAREKERAAADKCRSAIEAAIQAKINRLLAETHLIRLAMPTVKIASFLTR